MRTGQKIGGGSVSNGLYTLDLKNIESRTLQAEVGDENKVTLWHHHLGHAPLQCLRNIPFLSFANKRDSLLRCDACQFAKNKRSVYSVNINKRSNCPFNLIHYDVWYAPVTSICGHRYFVTFIDDATRVTWVYLLKSKDEVFHVFQTYHKMVEVKFDKRI